MARIIVVVNQKGGVGKTTTAINLGSYLAHLGKWVLLVDIDPQANATSGLGADPRKLPQCIYNTLLGNLSLRQIIKETPVIGYRFVPASLNLAGANVELVNLEKREYKLQEALDEVEHSYDYIIVDCPPSLGLLTINGLVASHDVLIPVQCEYYALEGLAHLLQTIQLVKENLNSQLNILGAVLTMFDRRNRLSTEVFEEIYKYFPERVFRTVIPRSVCLAEAPSHGQPISLYDAGSKGARAYEKLAKEILFLYNTNKF